MTGAGDVARRSFARRDVHAEAGRRVDLADAAADRAIALGDVRRQEIDAADVEPDGANRAHRHVAVVGMNDVGHVGGRAAGGEIRRRSEIHDAAALRHRLRREAGALQHFLGLRVELEPRQHLLVADAAPRILVHDLDQLHDGVLAVADDVPRRAPRRRDQLAVDDQQAMIVAFEERLDDHRARMLARDVEAVRDFRVRRQPDGDAAAVIAVVRLGDDRIADAIRGAHGLSVALHQLLPRHRQSERREDLVGLFLVARQLHRDVRRAAGDRRLDALLILAVAELHERLIVEPQPRNAARFRRTHQRCGRRSERAALREADEVVARFRPAPAFGHRAGRAQRLGQQRAQQPQAELAGGDAFVALRVFVDDGVDAGLAGAARLAERDFLARDVLQLDGDVLEHVAEPRALVLAHAPQESAGLAVRAAVLGEAGQRRGQAVDILVARACRSATLRARRGPAPAG